MLVDNASGFPLWHPMDMWFYGNLVLVFFFFNRCINMLLAVPKEEFQASYYQ